MLGKSWLQTVCAAQHKNRLAFNCSCTTSSHIAAPNQNARKLVQKYLTCMTHGMAPGSAAFVLCQTRRQASNVSDPLSSIKLLHSTSAMLLLTLRCERTVLHGGVLAADHSAQHKHAHYDNLTQQCGAADQLLGHGVLMSADQPKSPSHLW
jgi:hypothetical protein